MSSSSTKAETPWPRIRLHHPRNNALMVREGLSICFYMHRSHTEVGRQVGAALDAYLRAIEPQSLAWYPDETGDWQQLDARGWSIVRHQLEASPDAFIELGERPDAVSDHLFEYRGGRVDASRPEGTCAVAFWLPTEFLEVHGPRQVRGLALELGRLLPFDSGHAGLAFNMLQAPPALRSLAFRHPGMDIPGLGWAAEHLGTRVHGAHWLTFLGPPVLSALGRAAGLSARLTSASTHVFPLDEEHAVVCLGEQPEAGDTKLERNLTTYRELARVLEPWLYHSHHPLKGLTEEETRRWERRFLD